MIHLGVSVSWLQEHGETLRLYYLENPIATLAGCCIADVVLYTFAIPGAWVLAVGAGAIFGIIPGVLIITLGNTLGSMSAFVAGRWLLRPWVERRVGARFERIRHGFENHGNLYLFSLRVVPLMPHFLVNFGISLTHMKMFDFIWITALAGLPGTWAFVNAGTALARIHSIDDILTKRTTLSLLALALIPLLGPLWGVAGRWLIRRRWRWRS